MVVEALQGNLYLITLIFALLTAILGIIVINSLFKDKLEELFSDLKFFIFFFLITGYVLFALGELSWYLLFKVFEMPPTVSIPDLYWVSGSAVMFLSFIALSYTLYKNNGELSKLNILLILGAILAVVVTYFVSTIDLEATKSQGNVFLGYFYPIMSTLILITSANLLFHFRNVDPYEQKLILLFYANIGFLLGDLLYIYTSSQGIYGTLGMISDLAYIGAYCLSAVTFFRLMMKLH